MSTELLSELDSKMHSLPRRSSVSSGLLVNGPDWVEEGEEEC